MTIKNALISLISPIGQTIVGFVSVPVYIVALGKDGYGAYMVLQLIMLALVTFDFGISKLTIRRISELTAGHESRRNKTEESEAFSLGVVVSLVYGSCVLIFFTIFGHDILKIICSKTELIEEIQSGMYYLLWSMLLTLLYNIIVSVYDGMAKISDITFNQCMFFAGYSLIPPLLTIQSSGDLVSVLAYGAIIKTIGFGLLAIKFYKSLEIKFILPSIEAIRVEITRGRGILRNTLVAYFLENLDKYLLPYFKGPAAYTFYIIPFNLVSKTRMVPEAFNRALYPFFASETEAKALKKCEDYTQLIAIICLSFAAMLIILSDFIYSKWIPSIYDDQIRLVTNILIPGIWVSSIGYPAYAYAESRGNTNLSARVYIISLPLYIPIMIFATYFYGPVGCALSWSLRASFDSLYLLRMIGFEKYKLIKILGVGLIIIGSAFIVKTTLFNS